MCGRYALFELLDEIDHFLGTLDRQSDTEPNFNVAPTHQMPVALAGENGRTLRNMHWGFMGWKPKSGQRPFTPVNTRADSIPEKPMWRKAAKQQRCLVPMNGFYEWAGKKGNKTPYFVRGKEQELLAAAGLYSELSPAEGGGSFSIITTEPNELMEPIHDRMPAFLHPEEFEDWLNPDHTIDFVLDMLRPYPSDAMEAYIVSKEVGNVRNNHPGLVQKASLF